MANAFEGFSSETTEILMGIRMNNTKEWYNAHKDAYIAHVRGPMLALAEACAASLRAKDERFTPRPKVSRALRDTRFTANKEPIKECSWFFLRNDASPGIQHDEPTFFFEVSPDWWRMGLGYWPMKAADMAKYRAKINAAPALAVRLVQEACDCGFTLEDELYKKKMHDGSQSPEAQRLLQMKSVTFIQYGEHDAEMCSPAILDKVSAGFSALYPMYAFLLEASRGCSDTKTAQ